MKFRYTADLFLDSDCLLGEGPLWDAQHKVFYWVDIEGRNVHSFHFETTIYTFWSVPKRVGAVTLTNHANTLLMGLQGKLAGLNTATGLVQEWATIDHLKPQNRCNDGQIDAAGRLWIGTMQVDNQKNEGSLFCVSSDMKPLVKLTGLGISNGIAWSLDNKTMYFIDSLDKNIKAFDFDLASSNITNQRVIFTTHNDSEVPDGMCIDAEGMLWVAFWDGFRVARINPLTGEELAEIHVPVPQVTSCAFGGDNLDLLLITTAKVGLSEEALQAYPLSGSIFSCNVGVKGLLPYVFEK